MMYEGGDSDWYFTSPTSMTPSEFEYLRVEDREDSTSFLESTHFQISNARNATVDYINHRKNAGMKSALVHSHPHTDLLCVYVPIYGRK